MKASLSQSPGPIVVARLRTAGCVFARDEARLLMSAAETPAELAAMVDQRVAGMPLEQVLGWAEFCGLRISIDPGVFVPRRRTEFLVGTVVTEGVAPKPAVVVDLCCGSGAVGAALGAALGQVELHSVDLDPASARCARRNTANTGGRVYVGDLFEPLPAGLRGRVDILVACAPYVPTDSIRLLPPEARDHEPRLALDGGVDGLDVLRRLTAEAPAWLAPGGKLLVETGERQAPRLAEAIARNGLAPRVANSEDLDVAVVIGARVDLHERRA